LFFGAVSGRNFVEHLFGLCVPTCLPAKAGLFVRSYKKDFPLLSRRWFGGKSFFSFYCSVDYALVFNGSNIHFPPNSIKKNDFGGK
jgi:hypothetical protein